MENKNNDVEKIISYIEEKIASLKSKLAKYESPIMQDMAKNSPHLQMDYIRISAELQANEDNLMAIKNFTDQKLKKENGGSVKEKSDRKTGAAKKD